MTRNALIEKAKKKARVLRELRTDARYLKTVGKLKKEGLLEVHDVPDYRGQVFLEDALWAGEIEPRILELLPAILVRRPAFFAFLSLPADLEQVVREIKAGHPKTPYRGIAAEKYGQWVSFVGKRELLPKVMRSFRMSLDDSRLLDRLSEKTSSSRAEIIHKALNQYATSVQGL